MMKKIPFLSAVVFAAGCFGACGVELFHYKFDEGSGPVITNTSGTLPGFLGTSYLDPALDTVALDSESPSLASGDGSVRTIGKGFLIGEDTARVLDITNGPITIESWVKIDGSVPGNTSEGILAYGNSYKMGLKTSRHVFTLYGIRDITNSAAGVIPADQWVHLAAVWTPGVGVDFYVNGAHSFVEFTTTPARPIGHTYLSLGSEGSGNSLAAKYDRMRVHHAALSAAEIDSDATTPKPIYASTLAHYDFNQASLPATNSVSPPLPVGSAADVAYMLAGPSWTNGVSGEAGDTALFFDGTKRAIVPDPNKLIVTNSLNGNYTIEAWLKLPVGSNPTTRMIMFHYEGANADGSPAFAFSINTGRTLHTTTYGKSDINSPASVVPNDGNWHHVAVVHTSGANMRFYIDGVLTETVAYANGVGTRTNPTLTIGATGSGGNPFTGTLDRIRFSNEALSPAEFDFPVTAGKPFITVHPASQSVTVGNNMSFSVTAFSLEPPVFRWYFTPTSNPAITNLLGVNDATLTLNGVQPAQDGYYWVSVSNSMGIAISDQARLTVTTLPVITAHPAGTNIVVGETASFAVTATPAPGTGPLNYHWRYAPPGNPVPNSSLSAPNSATLTLAGANLTDQGFYSVIVSNEGGAVESTFAKLRITSPTFMTPLWQILPGERTYITPYNSSSAGLRDLERGMAYNPTTDHLLIGARVNSQVPVKGIYILNAATGAEVGQLPGTDIISGGTIWLTRVVCADDGVIYACNFGSLSDSNPLKIYRWANETASPTIAYQGNPVSGTGLANQQWGKNMTVRGSGANTQILMDTRNFMAVFTTTDGLTFTPSLLQPAGTPDDWNDGLAWGENGTSFWGKSDGKYLIQWGYTPGATEAPVLQTYTGFPDNNFGNFSFSSDFRYMAGLTIQAGADAVDLYDISDLARGPMLIDSDLFPVDSLQTVGYGNVYIANNRVFALNPNNGVVAFSIPAQSPVLEISRNGQSVVLSWPASAEGYGLQFATGLSGGWQPLGQTPVLENGKYTVTLAPNSSPTFFRLMK